ncbi:MAG TPA: alpha-hydroxy acid oxidase [Micromonosporaceae bacterium]|nr:alpha-hydroxy acid oxidase [Micromonosporaceae bacterium]
MDPINIADYEELAAKLVEPGAWDYYQGGSDDEVTLRANRTAFDRLRLRPRVMVDPTECAAATTVLGTQVSFPVLAAPVAYHGMAHPDAECATAEGVGRAGTVLVASINSNRTMEEIAAVDAGPRWLQLYLSADLDVRTSLIRRAEDAGYGALVLTVDRPRFGNRERDRRNGFRLPPHLRAANFGDATRDLAALAVATWADLDWLISSTALPVLVKGVLTGEDAAMAVEHGVAGVMVSNHGGRQLDGSLAGIEALPEVVAAVAGRCEVYCDGGVRRGTDVLKALALGARAVLVGRPTIWGLAVAGADGVAHVLDLLRTELLLAMALSGRTSVAEVDRSLVTRVSEVFRDDI